MCVVCVFSVSVSVCAHDQECIRSYLTVDRCISNRVIFKLSLLILML